MSAGDINIKIEDVIKWLTEQTVKYPTGEMPIITISNWLFDRRNERLSESKPKVSAEQQQEERLYQRFFPNDGDDVKLFERVVAAINVNPPEDIELLNPKKRYNSDKVKGKFPNVIDIFVTHFRTQNQGQKKQLDEKDFKDSLTLFITRVKSPIPSTMVITGKTNTDTVEYISNFIVNQIYYDPDTLGRIITEQSKESQMTVGTGWSGSDSTGAGGGRRSRRNSSSTRRRPRRRRRAAAPRPAPPTAPGSSPAAPRCR